MNKYLVIYFLSQSILMPDGRTCSIIACEPVMGEDLRPDPNAPICVAAFAGGDLYLPAEVEHRKIVADNPDDFETMVKEYAKHPSFVDLRDFSPMELMESQMIAAGLAGDPVAIGDDVPVVEPGSQPAA